MLRHLKVLRSRHGHSGSQSGFGFIHSGLSKSTPFGLYKSSVRDRFGFGSGLVNVQRTGITHCTFGFRSH